MSGMVAVRRYLERKGSWLSAGMTRTVAKGLEMTNSRFPGYSNFLVPDDNQ